MKKRLRKKKRVGEFTQYGFEVRVLFREGTSEREIDAFVDAWTDAVEARGLMYGGGTDERTMNVFVTRAARGSATEEDRAALGRFLEASSVVLAPGVGELVDAWRGRSPHRAR